MTATNTSNMCANTPPIYYALFSLSVIVYCLPDILVLMIVLLTLAASVPFHLGEYLTEANVASLWRKGKLLNRPKT